MKLVDPAGPQGPPGADSTVPGPAGPPGQITDAHIAAIVKKIGDQLKNDPRFIGPAGPIGPRGPPGSNAGDVDIDAIVKRVKAELGPIEVVLIRDNEQIDSLMTRPGGRVGVDLEYLKGE